MHIALLGDSTIDNVVWTGHPEEVPAQLRELLQSSGGVVSNLAADGFTTKKVLLGGVPTISSVKRQQAGDPFPQTGDGIFRPLDALESLDPPPTHAVISIGGNDIRAILGSLHQLDEVVKNFHSNYMSILDRVCKTVPKVVLMFQYRPSFHMDESYGVYRSIGSLPGPGDAVVKLNRLMEAIYNPILVVASQRRLPVIDLPRSFDIEDDSLYRCQIEPSAAGGSLIAELISHVVLRHDFTSTSTLYLKPSCSVDAEINNGDGFWSIPQLTCIPEHVNQPQILERGESLVSNVVGVVPNFICSLTRCLWIRR